MSITVDATGDATPNGLDAATFAILYARHRDALYRFCRAKTADPGLVEDIVHDVFEKAFASRRRFDRQRDFWPWLASIAVRVCIDAHRHSASVEAREQQYGRDTWREPFDVTSTTVLRALDQRRLGEQMNALPPRQRAALGLFALDGWSYEQIAHHLGSSSTAVKASIHRARARLREAGGRGMAAVLGVGRAARCRLQHRAARMQGTVLPSFDAFGFSAANALSSASAAAVALAIACGLLAPTAPAATARATSPSPRAASVIGPDAGGREGPQSPDSPSTVPRRHPPDDGGGQVAADLAASVLQGGVGNDDPETVYAQSFATSPDYHADPTIFVAGDLLGKVKGVAIPLLVSHDDGASWRRARAIGLAPVVELLLPTAYPRDNRLFAATVAGLQVSHDDGDTFETLVAMPGITDAAVSPAFDAGDPTLLFVAGKRLWQYDDGTGTVTPVVVEGTVATHPVLSVGYRVESADDRTVIVGTQLANSFEMDSGLHISRCARRALVGDSRVPTLACTSVKLPPIPTSELPLRLSPSGRSGVLYLPIPKLPMVSTDGGRNFRPARWWSGEDIAYRVHDLAAVPSSGESAIVAQHSATAAEDLSPIYEPPLLRTDDGGQTWSPLRVDLPHFEWARRVVVTPTGRIIAGSGSGGLGCSEDDGRTWARTCPPPG